MNGTLVGEEDVRVPVPPGKMPLSSQLLVVYKSLGRVEHYEFLPISMTDHEGMEMLPVLCRPQLLRIKRTTQCPQGRAHMTAFPSRGTVGSENSTQLGEETMFVGRQRRQSKQHWQQCHLGPCKVQFQVQTGLVGCVCQALCRHPNP